MAWPSGTKASTANVDQGGDKISLARADIKQNIDNVNDIIDHLNIASPSDGDVLRYSTSSGKWEQVAVSTFSSTSDIVLLGNRTYLSLSTTTPFTLLGPDTNPTTSGITVTTSPGSGIHYWTHNTTGNYSLVLYHYSTTANISTPSEFAFYDGSTLQFMRQGVGGTGAPQMDIRDPRGICFINYTVTSTTAQYGLRGYPGTCGVSPSIEVKNTYAVIQRH